MAKMGKETTEKGDEEMIKWVAELIQSLAILGVAIAFFWHVVVVHGVEKKGDPK